jgi:5-methyltetrahydrofolate--homocysteine methyltransferase
MADLASLGTAIETGDRATAVSTATGAIASGTDPQTILDAMTSAMDRVGARFQAGEIFVPEMLVAARAMKEAMAVLEPVLVDAGIRPGHKAVIGSIQGDLHDIGKNLVAMMWKGAGFKVIDLGANIGADTFVTAAREHDASIIGISALLTTTMIGMKDVVDAVHRQLPGVKVIVGGAPVTADYAESIGADGYAADAGSAVDVARAAVGRS